MGYDDIHIVESDERKCIFMSEIKRLTKTKVEIHNCRIEKLEFLDPILITARALASLTKLIEYIEIYMNSGLEYDKNTIEIPNMLFLKGKTYNQEILELNQSRQLNFKIIQSITDAESKILLYKK